MALMILLETDLIADAARELTRVYDLIRGRHGVQFRALERRPEALPAANHKPVIYEIWSDDRIVLIAAPPMEWTALLAEAQQLEVI